MKKINFAVLLTTILMVMAILFTSCNESARLTENNAMPSNDTSSTQCEHNYTREVTTEPTCIKDGIKTFTCSVCNDSYTEVIAATGKHNYTSKVTTEATCTKDGVKTFTCSVCNDSYTEKIAAGHKWTDATCTVAKNCSVCKLTEGDALGHKMENGECSRCGESEKWSFSEAYDLAKYAAEATANASKASDYAMKTISSSSNLVQYNKYAVRYVNIAKGYLESMKAIADSNVALSLTNTDDKYSTLQEKIDYAYNLCDEILNYQIDSYMFNTVINLYTECYSIQALTVDLVSMF